MLRRFSTKPPTSKASSAHSHVPQRVESPPPPPPPPSVVVPAVEALRKAKLTMDVEPAMARVRELSGEAFSDGEHRKELVDLGASELCVRVFKDPISSHAVKLMAAQTLWYLTRLADNHPTMFHTTGLIAAIVAGIKPARNPKDIVLACTLTLSNLANDPENQTAMCMTPDLIPTALSCVTKGESEEIKVAALGLIGNIATHPENRSGLFRTPTLADTIVSVVKNPSASEDMKNEALKVLSSLSDEDENVVEMFKLNGLMTALIELGKSPSTSTELKRTVLHLLCNFATHKELKAPIWMLTGMPDLMLEGLKHSETLESALTTLTELSDDDGNATKIVKVTGLLPLLITNASPSSNADVRKWSIWTLNNLAHCVTNQGTMMSQTHLVEYIVAALANEYDSKETHEASINALLNLSHLPDNRVALFKASGLIEAVLRVLNNVDSLESKKHAIHVLSNIADHDANVPSMWQHSEVTSSVLRAIELPSTNSDPVAKEISGNALQMLQILAIYPENRISVHTSMPKLIDLSIDSVEEGQESSHLSAVLLQNLSIEPELVSSLVSSSRLVDVLTNLLNSPVDPSVRDFAFATLVNLVGVDEKHVATLRMKNDQGFKSLVERLAGVLAKTLDFPLLHIVYPLRFLAVSSEYRHILSRFGIADHLIRAIETSLSSDAAPVEIAASTFAASHLAFDEDALAIFKRSRTLLSSLERALTRFANKVGKPWSDAHAGIDGLIWILKKTTSSVAFSSYSKVWGPAASGRLIVAHDPHDRSLAVALATELKQAHAFDVYTHPEPGKEVFAQQAEACCTADAVLFLSTLHSRDNPNVERVVRLANEKRVKVVKLALEGHGTIPGENAWITAATSGSPSTYEFDEHSSSFKDNVANMVQSASLVKSKSGTLSRGSSFVMGSTTSSARPSDLGASTFRPPSRLGSDLGVGKDAHQVAIDALKADFEQRFNIVNVELGSMRAEMANLKAEVEALRSAAAAAPAAPASHNTVTKYPPVVSTWGRR